MTADARTDDREKCEGCDRHGGRCPGCNTPDTCPSDRPCGVRTYPNGRCPRTSKRTGHQCTVALKLGHKVCRWHGGNAPHVRKAAEQRAAILRMEHDIETDRERFGIPIEIPPDQALLALVYEWAGQVAFMRRKIERLFPGYGTGPIVNPDTGNTEVVAGIAGPDHLGDGRPHVYWTMYTDACDKLARYAKAAIDAGIAERQVQVAEQHAAILAVAVRGVLAELGIPGRADLPQIVGRHLRLAAGGPDTEADIA